MAAKCDECGEEKKVLVCGRCKRARYCSKDCQTRAWKAGHRSTCSPTAPASSAFSAASSAPATKQGEKQQAKEGEQPKKTTGKEKEKEKEGEPDFRTFSYIDPSKVRPAAISAFGKEAFSQWLRSPKSLKIRSTIGWTWETSFPQLYGNPGLIFKPELEISRDCFSPGGCNRVSRTCTVSLDGTEKHQCWNKLETHEPAFDVCHWGVVGPCVFRASIEYSAPLPLDFDGKDATAAIPLITWARLTFLIKSCPACNHDEATSPIPQFAQNYRSAQTNASRPYSDRCGKCKAVLFRDTKPPAIAHFLA